MLYSRGIGDEKGEPNYEKAGEWFRRAAQQGHPEAQYELALCYLHGEGVAKKPQFEEALRYLVPAAENGIAGAQYTLGMCYLRGMGVRRSPAEAAKWFQRAAERGNADARTQLAELRRKQNFV